MLGILVNIYKKLCELVSGSLNPAGGFDVNVQDQTTRPLFIPFSRATGLTTTLTSQPAIGDRTINVADSTGFAGLGVGIFPGDSSGSFYFGEVVSTPTGTSILLDSPVDYAFPIATTQVVQLNYEMNVDGSSTPQIFSVPGADAFPYDITRLMIVYKTDGAVDFNGFGDGAVPLTNGIAIRRINGETQNFFNIKKNLDWAGIAYDFTRYSKVSPQDVDAVAVRLTFAGPSKLGVAVRLVDASESLEAIVQDNLLQAGPYGIVSMRIFAEGHKVD